MSISFLKRWQDYFFGSAIAAALPDEADLSSAGTEPAVAAEVPETDDSRVAVLTVGDAVAVSEPEAILTAAPVPALPSAPVAGRELAVISSSVPDLVALTASIGSRAEVVVLTQGTGLTELLARLDETGDKYDAVHFISHGNSEGLSINGEFITTENLDEAEWQELGMHLNSGAGLLFYACNAAAEPAGQELIDRIAAASGAAAAASTDLTGIGGDSDLEYRTGSLTAETISFSGYDFNLESRSVTVTTAAGLSDALAEAAGGAYSEYTITLGADITLTELLKYDFASALTLTIQSSGEYDTLTGNGADGIFFFAFPADVNINLLGLTLENAGESAVHLGILGGTGTLNVRNSLFRQNSAVDGAALAVDYNDAVGSVTIADSVFTGNTALNQGGAVDVDGGWLTIENSTFSGNTVTGSIYAGGAVSAVSSQVVIHNSTFADNSAASGLGGAVQVLCIGGTGSAEILDTVFSGNTAGDGRAVYLDGVQTVIGNSIGLLQLQQLAVENGDLLISNADSLAPETKKYEISLDSGTSRVQGSLTIANGSESRITGGTQGGLERAAGFSVAGDAVVDNKGHLNADVVSEGTVTITNTSSETLLGQYIGQTVSVTNTNTGTATAVTLRAYGDGSAAGTLILFNNGTFDGINLLEAGRGDASGVVSGDGVITVSGIGSFGAGDSTLRAGTITLTDKTVQTVSGTLTVDGTLNFGSGSGITLANNGVLKFYVDGALGSSSSVITINDYTDGKRHLVIDYAGTGTLEDGYYSTVVANYDPAKYLQVGNDLYYYVVGDVAYINTAYVGEIGSKTADGRGYVGLDAFTSFDEAIAAGFRKMVQTGGSYGGTSAAVYAAQGTVLTVENAFYNNKSILAAGINGTIDTTEENYRTSNDSAGDINLKILGGTFDGNVIGADVATGGAAMRTGTVNVAVSGGTFGMNFAAGMYYRTSTRTGGTDSVTGEVYTADINKNRNDSYVTGDINLLIGGGTAGSAVVFNSRVYGGNMATNDTYGAKTVVEGDINITLDASVTDITFQSHVIAGSRGIGRVTGDINVVITGNGDNLHFAKGQYLYGASSAAYYQVKDLAGTSIRSEVTYMSANSSSNLIFRNFQNYFEGKISMFQTITFAENTCIYFHPYREIDLTDIHEWNLTWDGNTATYASLVGVVNSFEGDTVNINYDELQGDDILLRGMYDSFGSLRDAIVTFNGATVAYDAVNKCWSDGEAKLSVARNIASGQDFLVMNAVVKETAEAVTETPAEKTASDAWAEQKQEPSVKQSAVGSTGGSPAVAAAGNGDTAYVNTDYTGEYGSPTADGRGRVGIDAFTTFTDALAAGFTKIVQTGGSYGGTSAAVFAGGGALTVENAVYNNKTILCGGLNVTLDSAVENFRTSHDASGNVALTILGGTFAGNVAGADVVSSGSSRRTGDVTVNIAGGNFGMNFSAGMYYRTGRTGGVDPVTGLAYTAEANKSRNDAYLSGNIDLTIGGGTAGSSVVFNSRVYGGNMAGTDTYGSRTTVDGNINITIDASVTDITFNNHVIAGSRGAGSVTGNITVTVTGNGDNLHFRLGQCLYGASSAAYYQTKDLGGTTMREPVTYMSQNSTRSLIFRDFQNCFSGKISMFDSITFSDNVAMGFGNGNDMDLTDINTWNLTWDGNNDTFANLRGVTNSFIGDTINVRFTGTRDDDVLLIGNYDAFESLQYASSVTFDGHSAFYNAGDLSWTDGNYKLYAIHEQSADYLKMMACGE